MPAGYWLHEPAQSIIRYQYVIHSCQSDAALARGLLTLDCTLGILDPILVLCPPPTELRLLDASVACEGV